MAYTTTGAVKLVLSGTQEEYGGTAAELSSKQIQYEIDSTKADIDAALYKVYVIPFDSRGDKEVPAIIHQINTDIAAYACDLNYRKGREYDNQNMPVPLRYQRAQQLLDNLRAGTISINWPRVEGGALVVHQYPYRLMVPEHIFNTRRTW